MAMFTNEPLLLVHDENNSTSSEENPSLVLDATNLSTILGRVGDRPLSIISIVGPQKSGKSLVFGYLVKYLSAAENDDPDWIDWTNKNKPLEDFKWPNAKSLSSDSPGIWAFNKPFFLKDGEDSTKEVAVILLYTQTADKGNWSKVSATTSALTGLSILASSCTIFNVTKAIDEKCLSAIGSGIADAMQGITIPGKRDQPLIPFQNATFLIRDWSYPTEYPYGMSGGREYVRLEKLKEKLGHTRHSRLNRQVTNSVFENVAACLLPFPGNDAIKPNFKGSIAELDNPFVETLKDFIGEVIDLDKLVIKKSTEKTSITKAEWKLLLGNYIDGINGGSHEEMNGEKLLKILGVKRTVLEGEQKQYIKIALKVYGGTWKKYDGKERKEGKEKTPDDIHKLAKKRALKAFKNEAYEDNCDDTGSEQKVDKKMEKLLKEKLEEKFLEMKEIKEKRQIEWIEKCKVDLVGQYTEIMTATFLEDGKGKTQSENWIKMESNETMTTLKGSFLGNIGATRDVSGRLDGKKEMDFKDFEQRLEQAEQKILPKIFKPETQDSFGRSTAGESSISDFEATRMSFHKANKFETFSAKSKELQTNKMLNKPLFEGRRRDEKRFEREQQQQPKTSREQQKLNEGKNKERAKTLINSLKENHLTYLTRELEKGTTELDNVHERQLDKIMEQFENELPFSSNSQDLNLYKSILEDDLRSALTTVKSKSRQLSRSKQQNLVKAMKEACINFETKLEMEMEDNGKIDRDALEKAGTKFMEMELESLTEKFGKTDVEKMREQVVKEMGQILERFKGKSERGRTLAEQQSKRMISEKKADYVEAMKRAGEKIGRENEMAKEHERLKKKIAEDFRKQSPIRENVQVLSEQVQELETGLDQHFTELSARWKLKLEGEAGTQKLVIQQGRQFYSEQMDKHFQNHEFILEADLLKLHQKVCRDTFRKCRNVEMSQIQQNELKAGLDQAFKRYQEDNQMNMNVEPAIGIDLGTTFSCVSVYQKGEIKIIPNSVGKYTTPSYVLFHPSGEEIVGVSAKERAYENPEGTIFDAKRILGRKFDDAKLQEDMKLWPFSVVDGGRGIPMIQVNGKKLEPEIISAKILEQLKKDAEAYLKREVTKAVITVPAYFTDGQKQATIDAGKMACLKAITILTEPVAAAMAYKLQYSFENKNKGGERHILIFDLGGGTFDVAILKTSEGNIEVLTVDGDTHLGGEDFDKNMMNYCAEEFKKKNKVDLFKGKDSTDKKVRDDVRRRLKRLQGECERQKIALASARGADVSLDSIYKDMDLNVTITRETFEKINATLFETTIQVVEKALKAAELKKAQIDDVVLVGGSTRIPKIQKMLSEFFDGKELDKKINPDEAVAHGAGLMAAIKKGNVSKGSAAYTKIQDVTPMPIGVEVYGGGFSAIIPKSTKIPMMLKEKYKTAHNNQTSVQITIYEGEDPIAVKNKHLGDFYLNGIPPKDAGVENIDVEMVINDQGILHVTAKCSSTGTTSAVTVTENKQRMGQHAIMRYIAEKRTS